MDDFTRFLRYTRAAIESHGPDHAALVQDVGGALERLLAAVPIEVDGHAAPGDFNGRLLYEDSSTGYIAVLMTWGPGARTPIHDHGTWGVFGVCRGSIEFTNFMRVDEGRVRPVARFVAGPGDVSYVIPPEQEIHQIHNPTARTAWSIHLYGRNIGF
jgi:predicted metal-dependent enzyme (double-stranded beta helix superfamily)